MTERELKISLIIIVLISSYFVVIIIEVPVVYSRKAELGGAPGELVSSPCCWTAVLAATAMHLFSRVHFYFIFAGKTFFSCGQPSFFPADIY